MRSHGVRCAVLQVSQFRLWMLDCIEQCIRVVARVLLLRRLGWHEPHGGPNSYLNLIAQPAETRWSWWGRVIFYHSDVPGRPPVGTSLGVTFSWLMSCRMMRLVEEPGEENATVLPFVSLMVLMPLSGRAYQNASGAPVASAEMIFTGIPLAKAAMA